MGWKTIAFSSALATILVGLAFVMAPDEFWSADSAPAPPDNWEITRRLDSLEDRLEILDMKLGDYVLADSGLPLDGEEEPTHPAEATGEASEETDGEGRAPSADDGLTSIQARLDNLDLRVRGLEVDPVERGYSFLESDNATLRLEGIRLLKRVAGHDSEALAALRDMLQDPDGKVRIASIDALGDVGDKEAIPQLAQLLTDEDAKVRRETIFGLLRLGGKDQGHTIAAMLEDPDKIVRAKAAYALGRLKYEQGAKPLLAALRDTDEYVRGEVIVALAQTGDKTALPALRDLYDNDPGNHRYRLVRSLKTLGDSQPFQTEFTRLSEIVKSDTSPDARLEALRSLSWFARREANGLFRAALKDPNSRVRSEARKVLYSSSRSGSKSPRQWKPGRKR